MALLLGPPSSGKTTLMLALAGKLESRLRVLPICDETHQRTKHISKAKASHSGNKVTGKITYCGHELSEFIPRKTCAYISQHDLHNGEMTVRETLDFSARCLGVGARYEMLSELLRRGKDAGIKPDPGIDAFMKATALGGQKTSLVTVYSQDTWVG